MPKYRDKLKRMDQSVRDDAVVRDRTAAQEMALAYGVIMQDIEPILDRMADKIDLIQMDGTTPTKRQIRAAGLDEIMAVMDAHAVQWIQDAQESLRAVQENASAKGVELAKEKLQEMQGI